MRQVHSNVPHRVVVTGMGVVSSLGIGWPEFWQNLLAGKSGISRITAFDTSMYDRHYAGEIKDFKPERFIGKRKIQSTGRASQLAIAAAKLAIEDAGISLKDLQGGACGVSLGTTMGEPQVMEILDAKHWPSIDLQVNFESAVAYPASAIPNNVANYFKLNSQNMIFANACAAGNYAVSYAFDLLRTGKVNFMLAGGADAFSRIAFTGFSRLFAIAPEQCQPFDKNRKGMIPGEGAGILFMETLEHAKQRKANIYAEIAGCGMSCDAHHMTAPDSSGVAKAVFRALKSANVNPEDVDYISAHGTGTKENDKAESQAIHAVFGKKASRIPVSSIKSMLGHTMGAAAALESIACCLAIKTAQIPPTINFSEKDPECDVDCVPNSGRNHEVKIAVNSSQAFGGNNACLILEKLGSYAK